MCFCIWVGKRHVEKVGPFPQFVAVNSTGLLIVWILVVWLLSWFPFLHAGCWMPGSRWFCVGVRSHLAGFQEDMPAAPVAPVCKSSTGLQN